LHIISLPLFHIYCNYIMYIWQALCV